MSSLHSRRCVWCQVKDKGARLKVRTINLVGVYSLRHLVSESYAIAGITETLSRVVLDEIV